MPNAYSRAAKAHNHDNEGIRLQKLLAQAGFGSRRKCEEIITDGRVEIDGELITELGTRVDPKRQEVRVDGSRVRVNPNHVTLALNKPKRVLSAMEDPKGRYTLRDIVGDKYERIFHMGRLDYDSEGLILMTNDGELSQHVMHPKYEVEKTYIATLEGRISGQVCRRLVTTGVKLQPRKHVGQGRAAFGQEPHRAPYFRLDRFSRQASGTHADRSDQTRRPEKRHVSRVVAG